MQVATMPTWQLQEATARLGELIERARAEGPQTIARDGVAYAVVLSTEDYRGQSTLGWLVSDFPAK
jgi:prevent-host-death family protein